jgi:hypothetical protein
LIDILCVFYVHACTLQNIHTHWPGSRTEKYNKIYRTFATFFFLPAIILTVSVLFGVRQGLLYVGPGCGYFIYVSYLLTRYVTQINVSSIPFCPSLSVHISLWPSSLSHLSLSISLWPYILVLDSYSVKRWRPDVILLVALARGNCLGLRVNGACEFIFQSLLHCRSPHHKTVFTIWYNMIQLKTKYRY